MGEGTVNNMDMVLVLLEKECETEDKIIELTDLLQEHMLRRLRKGLRFNDKERE